MKFIRDIIGEKRQMAEPIDGTSVDAVSEDDFVEETTPEGRHEADIALFENDLIIDVEDVAEEPLEESSQDNKEDFAADLGVSEEVAKFFADTDEQDDFTEDFLGHEAQDEASNGSEPGSSPDHAETAEEDDGHAMDSDDVQADVQIEDDEKDDADRALSDVFRATDDMDDESLVPAHEPDEAASMQHDDAQTQDVATEDLAAESPAAQPDLSALRPLPSRASEAPQAETAPAVEAEPPQNVEVPQPAVGRGASRHGRVKTRLLGFSTAMETETDPMADTGKASAAPHTSFPVGWLIVIEGAGRGSAFTLFNGVSTIGRGEDQTVRLNFGDNSISRENHASVAYDPRHQGFFVGHGGKANIVRRNDRPVLSTEEMAAGDLITIGETTLRFVPFCGPDFSWEREEEAGQAYANLG